jgi:hypothetical protein
MDPRRTDPRHKGSEVSTGFATDLSTEECWVAATVEAWASGHTHFNCTYTDKSGKAIISNQKGYYFFPQKTVSAQRVFTFGQQLEGNYFKT